MRTTRLPRMLPARDHSCCRRPITACVQAVAGALVGRAASCHASPWPGWSASARPASPRWPATERRRGLLGRDGVEGAFVIDPCRWVHTIGMRFPLDVAYVDEDGNVVKTVRMARHGSAGPCRGGRWVIEAEAGAFARWGPARRRRRRAARRRAEGDAWTGAGWCLVATPIGNLGDLSPRAVEALADADADLLRGHAAHRAAAAARRRRRQRLAVCNEHTERRRVGDVLAVLDDGGDVAVVTDAGTPGISDPASGSSGRCSMPASACRPCRDRRRWSPRS